MHKATWSRKIYQICQWVVPDRTANNMLSSTIVTSTGASHSVERFEWRHFAIQSAEDSKHQYDANESCALAPRCQLFVEAGQEQLSLWVNGAKLLAARPSRIQLQFTTSPVPEPGGCHCIQRHRARGDAAAILQVDTTCHRRVRVRWVALPAIGTREDNNGNAEPLASKMFDSHRRGRDLWQPPALS